MPRNDLIQLRSDTAANWTSVNPILATGEQGFETDTGKSKIGTGSTAWTSLPYLSATSNDGQISSLRRWNQQFAKTREGLVTGGSATYVTDILWVGDSIGEGWSSVELNGTPSKTTMVNVFTDNLSKIANPEGRAGRWVPAGGDWYGTPRFSDQDSSMSGPHTVIGGAFPSGSLVQPTFTSSGTSVTTAATYTAVTQSATSGSGTGAVFTIKKTGSGTAYAGFITVTVTNGGTGYALGDTITIPGASLGGATSTNNLTLTVGGSVSGANEVFLSEDYATSIFPTAGNASIYALYVGIGSISYTGKRNNAGKTVLTGVTIISSAFLVPSNTTFPVGTTVYFGGDDTLTKGFSLRARNLNPIAGQNIGDTATLEFTGDNVIVYYRKVKFLTGNIQFSLELKDSSGVYQPFYTSSSIYTYKSTGVSYEQDLVAWNAATAYGSSMARGDYRLKVYNYTTSPSGTNYSVSFDGAYVCDGNTDQGVRVWNSSKYGTNFSSFNSNVDTTYNADWLSALRNALVNPSLVVIALGTNESANPTTIESGLIAMVNSINDAYAVGYLGKPYPSFAFFVPPADSNTISSEWDLVRNTYASVASNVGAALWNWAEFTGDVNNETKDPYGWTVDKIHPNKVGHRAIGDFATSQVLIGTITSGTIDGGYA